ncbi:MAG: isoleucine--tRNA ligase, partial [Bacteroidota bacterium]
MPYPEYKNPDYSALSEEILAFWKENRIFEKSIETREGHPAFTFYEGPPSANGIPGVHHVMARAVKDIFCRYKTLKGFKVLRKGGWDTHGLPVELQVEKELGITKDDIGKLISVQDYNAKCREAVMKFTDQWNDLTEKMGYWVDLEKPYVTYEAPYIESCWHLLKKLYDKDLLYKGYTIQPYSPAAGTGLSSHELNQPGCYKMVRDTSVVAQFKVIRESVSEKLYDSGNEDIYFLAWTTTPWTLPANAALAVGKNIKYVKVRTYNPYTYLRQSVILASDLVGKYFTEKQKEAGFADYTPGDKLIPFELLGTYTGAELLGIRYEQLMPYVQPDSPAFRVIPGDFVSTEDGTGIVHISPTFGSDDFRAAQQAGIPPIMVKGEDGNPAPLVDKKGRLVAQVTDFAGMYVKNYNNADENAADYKSTDVLISIMLKEQNKAFKVEKYEHSYPHCWRTDKPVLYYPMDSWFIRTTACKERLVELNKRINWKPASTGTGRFGNWLENLVDWNLSRSRYWGTPLPIWRTKDGKQELCIGSIEELASGADVALKSGLLSPAQTEGNITFLESIKFGKADLHRPYVDDIFLLSPDAKEIMTRETDLVDVWFDSGAMPYAQWHFPFENNHLFSENFPADFIAEGVDQTRGWFFTLHALAVMLYDEVAFRNVIANGLVLAKDGQKMSKRLGNAVDPFQTIKTYGPDATRWYMIANAPPWENLKFNTDGVAEVQRKFFGTLQNTYAFFALY